jgi:hypothetical protein
MDYGALISRAFKIVRQNRALWFLGFLAALGGVGGGGGFNFNLPSGNSFGRPGTSSGTTPSLPPGSGLPELPSNFGGLAETGIIAIVLGLVCFFLVLGVALWLMGLVANGGLIAGANQVEEEGRTRFGYAWSRGASKLASFIGMRIVLAIPGFILTLLIIGIVVAAVVSGGVLAAMSNMDGADGAQKMLGVLFAALSGAICIIIPLALAAAVLNILVSGTKMFGDRAIMLGDAGAMDAIRQGWALLRSNFVNVMLTGLMLWVISLVIGFIVLFIVGIILAPSFVLLAVQLANTNGDGAATGSLVGVIAVLIGSLFLAAVVGSIINALVIAFRATLWTLAYRQFTGRGVSNANTTPSTSPTIPELR